MRSTISAETTAVRKAPTATPAKSRLVGSSLPRRCPNLATVRVARTAPAKAKRGREAYPAQPLGITRSSATAAPKDVRGDTDDVRSASGLRRLPEQHSRSAQPAAHNQGKKHLGSRSAARSPDARQTSARIRLPPQGRREAKWRAVSHVNSHRTQRSGSAAAAKTMRSALPSGAEACSWLKLRRKYRSSSSRASKTWVVRA